MRSNNKDYAAAKALSLEDIPVIDFAPLIENDDIEGVSKQLMSAAQNTGFSISAITALISV